MSLSFVSVLFKVPISVCVDHCKAGTRKVAQKGEPFCCFDCFLCTEGKFSNVTGKICYFNIIMSFLQKNGKM